MLLGKLESGFLRFETQQGLAAAEPTFWQRVYLLWTFRNFHQLSPLLLNPRQTALINNLFRQQTVIGPDEYEPGLEIGIVENFVPPVIEIGTMPAARSDASRTMKTNFQEQALGQSFARRVTRIAASPAIMIDGPPGVNGKEAKKAGARIDCVETAPRNVLGRFSEPIVFWLRSALSNLATFRPLASRKVMFRFAGAIGALLLCVYCAIAWHRTGVAPGSQTHNSVPRLNSKKGFHSAPKPTPDAVNLATEPDVSLATEPDMNLATEPQLPTETIPDQEPRVKPSPAKVASSITSTNEMMTPERGSRVPAARVARSRQGAPAAAFSRAPTSRSTRRLTLAPGSRGALARSAKSYFDLADQQLHKGNYAAASANYKRAWRIEEHIAAAKGRLARARMTMQAEKARPADQR